MILRDLFESSGFNLSEGGTYVDVGAHHPRRFSNTHFFYELGWNGLNFEPNEEVSSLFKNERPKDKTFPIALTSKPGQMEFHTYSDSALNSLVKRDAELSSTPYNSCGSKLVTVSTLALQLRKNFNKILPSPNFLDIDVEGSELEVLKGNNWSKFRFDYILIELKLKSLDHLSQFQTAKYLANINYIPVACTRLTTIFKNKLL